MTGFARAIASRRPSPRSAAASGRSSTASSTAVRAENPVYAEVLGGPEGLGIRLGDRAGDQGVPRRGRARSSVPAGETGEVWRRLGEAEFQAGRGLEALRAAFRTGTRAAWRGAAELAARAGHRRRDRDRARRGDLRLHATSSPPTSSRATCGSSPTRPASASAGAAGWRRCCSTPRPTTPRRSPTRPSSRAGPVPRTAGGARARPRQPGARSRGGSISTRSSAPTAAARTWSLPDPDGPGRHAERSTAPSAATAAALGPTVAHREAPRSLRWARLALELVQRGALPSEGPTRVADHLATVILLQRARASPEALVAATASPPSTTLPDAERERLLETLAAWLAHQRHTPADRRRAPRPPPDRPLPDGQAPGAAGRRARDRRRPVRARAGAPRAAGPPGGIGFAAP